MIPYKINKSHISYSVGSFQVNPWAGEWVLLCCVCVCVPDPSVL